ncbi:MAG TPA: hypothetical protein VG452_00755, partial [Egibacteraceae bacterium]|nr:hypothetical protein [Egibacteraceae bacterium]
MVTQPARRAPSRLLIAGLGLALALPGCLGQDLPVVETARVHSGQVTQTVSAPAQVDAAARQDVPAAVSGVVVALEAADGDTVQAGQTVVRLASTQVDLARQQAAAAQSAAAGGGEIRVPDASGATLAATRDAVARLDAAVGPRLAEARAQAGALADPQQRAAADASIDAVEASYLSTRAALLASGQAVAAQQQATARALADALDQAVRQATAPQRAQAQAAAAAAAAQAEHLVVSAPLAGT